MRLETEGVNLSNRVEYLLEAVVYLLKLQVSSKGVSVEQVSKVADVPKFVHIETRKPKTPEQLAAEEEENAKNTWLGLTGLAKANGVKVIHYNSIAERDAAEQAEEQRRQEEAKNKRIIQWPPTKSLP